MVRYFTEDVLIGGARATPPMDMDKVIKCYVTGKRNSSAVGMNEVRHERYKRAFREVFRDDYFVFLNHTNNGLALLRNRYALNFCNRIKLSRKVPGVNPSRELSEVSTSPLVNPDLNIIYHIEHWPNAAHNDRFPLKSLQRRVRLRLWKAAKRRSWKRKKWLLDSGIADVIVVEGDFNKDDLENPPYGQWIAGHNNIVKIGVCSKKYRVRPYDPHKAKREDFIEYDELLSIPAHTDNNPNDHPFKRVRLRIPL